MNLFEFLITNILALDPFIKWPGIFLIILFLLKALGHVFRLRLISAVTNTLYAAIIALVLAQYGNEIMAFLLDALKDRQTT